MSELRGRRSFSNEEVDALFKFSGGVALMADAEGTVLTIVGDIESLVGVASEHFIGARVFANVQKEDRERAKERWAYALEHKAPLPGEDYWLSLNGHWVCVRATTSNFLDDPDVTAMVMDLFDITELKHAESARNALVGTSSALVRAGSEGELYDELCHVVVDDAAFDLAWIGLVDETRPLGVRIVASGGPAAYSDTLEKLSGTRIYQGPIVDAIHTREIQVVTDIVALPESAVWRNLALAHGYGSLAVLPLADSGILAIYSKRANAFNHEAVLVLAALVDNLSKGIEALRSRSERILHRLRLESSLQATVRAIATAAELRDPYTAGHQRRVEDVARAIATDIGLEADETTGIGVAASIHDIGKLVVPAEILSKPGRLTETEFELVKIHCQAGYDIVAGIDFPWPVAEMILDHHERLNGSGYPRGLEASDISLGTRILSVADVVEAMHSHRPYRAGLGIDVALQEIENGLGTLYDSDVGESCIGLFRRGEFEFSV